jgi:uncharacterized protein (DUF2235 family)
LLQVITDGQGNLSALDVNQLEKLLVLLLERQIKKLANSTDLPFRDAKGPTAKQLQSLSRLSTGGVGLIHFTAALGYDWAVNILLQGGAKVNLKVGKQHRLGPPAYTWVQGYTLVQCTCLLKGRSPPSCWTGGRLLKVAKQNLSVLVEQ